MKVFQLAMHPSNLKHDSFESLGPEIGKKYLIPLDLILLAMKE